MDIVCNFCGSAFSHISIYQRHLRIHRFNTSFSCNLHRCNIVFKKYTTFISHLGRSHMNVLSSNDVIYKCTAIHCMFSHDSFEIMTKHLKDHLAEGVPVYCPLNCRKKSFETSNALKIHNRYYHKNVENTRDPVDWVDSSSTRNSTDGENQNDTTTQFEESQHISNAANFFGTMFLGLLSKHHVTGVAVQQVVDAMAELTSSQEEFNHHKISEIGSKFQLSEHETNVILHELGAETIGSTLFDHDYGIFRSEHMRKKYFKENFSYVEPVQIEISANSNRFIYYVPILRTLESLFNGGFGLIPLLFTDHRKIDGFMTNYTEGLRFMNNMFCQQPNSLHIFLYQDGFGTVNPLGDAKVRHKLVGVYFTIGNMHPALRATTENSFLVLMCLEKDLKQYGTEAIFKVLIDDLKLLETEGMHINIAETEVVIHGTIFALLGDNLGTHQMAGLVENFSTQQYFSRYCYSTLQEFRRTPLKSCQMRYQATYEKDLQDLYTSGKPIRGVKKPTIFNELKHFQLFEYGMPPCLAHDLFLGCFNYDIMLVLRRFIRNKLVREQYLQRRLNYLLKKFELNSKICLNFKKKCVTSKAIDIWHMIQVIPLLLLKIKQVHTDPAFKLIIMLKNITDIITAPLISIRQIAMLKLEISQYLEIRSSLFMTPLRPKHHYLFHYPHLILQYGPLMQFSTLSGERKHSYFKTALRHAGNYKNILKLCCERHQYWQAYLSTNRQRFHEKVVFEGNVRTCNDLDGDEKQVMESLACYGEYNKYTNSIIYMGTPLKRGYCVFIRHDDYEDSFYIILIHGIVCNDITNDIMVYGEKQTAFYFTELGMPVVEHGNCTKSLSCMNVNELPDITPLKQYTCQGNTYLFNKHAIPRK